MKAYHYRFEKVLTYREQEKAKQKSSLKMR